MTVATNVLAGWSESISYLLLTTAPYVVLFGVLNSPHTALYVSPEALLLFVFTFAFRYQQHLLAISSLIHIVGLLSAFYLVKHHQRKFRNQHEKPSTSNTEPLLPHRDETEPSRYDYGLPPPLTSSRLTAFLQWKWMLVTALFCTYIVVMTGKHSVLQHIAAWIVSEPMPPLMEDLGHQFVYTSYLLEMNANVLQSIWTSSVYNFADKVIQGLQNSTSTDAMDAMLTVPTSVWVYIACTNAGALAMLPGLISTTVRGDATEKTIMQLSLLVSQAVSLIGFLVLVRIASRKKQRALGQESQSGASIRL